MYLLGCLGCFKGGVGVGELGAKEQKLGGIFSGRIGETISEKRGVASHRGVQKRGGQEFLNSDAGENTSQGCTSCERRAGASGVFMHLPAGKRRRSRNDEGSSGKRHNRTRNSDLNQRQEKRERAFQRKGRSLRPQHQGHSVRFRADDGGKRARAEEGVKWGSRRDEGTKIVFGQRPDLHFQGPPCRHGEGRKHLLHQRCKKSKRFSLDPGETYFEDEPTNNSSHLKRKGKMGQIDKGGGYARSTLHVGA